MLLFFVEFACLMIRVQQEKLGFPCLDSLAFKETSALWLDYNINKNIIWLILRMIHREDRSGYPDKVLLINWLVPKYPAADV